MNIRISAVSLMLLGALAGVGPVHALPVTGPAPVAPGTLAFMSSQQKIQHMQQLTASGRFEEADAFYAAITADFNNGVVAPVLSALEAGLNARYSTMADALLARLAAVSSAGAPDTWAATSATVAQARAVLKQYSQFAVLRPAAVQSPKISRLIDALAKATATLNAQAAASFAVYDHRNADFFSRYPVALDDAHQAALVNDSWQVWVRQVSAMDLAHADALVQAWVPMLESDAAQQELAADYKALVMKDRGWGAPLTIDKLWVLHASFDRVGLDTRYLEGQRAVLVLTGAKPGPEPEGWDADVTALQLPFLLSSREDMDAQIARLGKAGYDNILILDPSRVGQINSIDTAVPQTGSKGHGESYTYLSATAQRRVEQQVGIYYLDLRNNLLYRSKVDDDIIETDTIYGKLDAQDPRKAELEKKSRDVLDNFAEPLALGVFDADELVPDLLDQPVTGSRWQASDLDRLVNEDETVFVHRIADEISEEKAASEDVAQTLVVDIDSNDDAETVASNSVPDGADCKAFGVEQSSEHVASLWQVALAQVAPVSRGSVQGSYSLMAAHEAIATLREDVARDAGSGDRDQALATALSALRDTADALDDSLDLDEKFVDADAVDHVDDYYRQRFDNAAYNTVAATVSNLRPELVADLYRVYQYVYAAKSGFGGESEATLFAMVDDMLKQVGEKVAVQDAKLTARLNGDAASASLQAVSTSIHEHCATTSLTAETRQLEAPEPAHDAGVVVSADPVPAAIRAIPLGQDKQAPTAGAGMQLATSKLESGVVR